MARSKASKPAGSPLPLAPWVYLNQCTVGPKTDVASALQALIPNASIVLDNPAVYADDSKASNNSVTIIKATGHSLTTAANLAKGHHQLAIKRGCNFASVHVTCDKVDKSTTTWGSNHLEISTLEQDAEEVAKKIYKWLFKTFAVAETLYLIPEKEMLAIDDKSFPGYAYCAIADSRAHTKDAKIQFVALITSKPAVGADGRLHWTVSDRTGTANFYFQYRGSSSLYTWNWVLALQPGDRKALPRMPMVKVKEKKRVKIAKAPFRGVGLLVGATGAAVRGIGQGLSMLGHKIKLGNSSEWIPEADVKDGRVGKKYTTPEVKKDEIKIFNEKGEKMWKWEDDDASTTAGSVYEKEFC